MMRARFGGALPGLLRENVPFRRFFAGQAISLIGDQITLVALPLVGVLALDAGPAEMGYLTAAGLAPNLVFALHAGAWVDRRGRRRQTMLVADVGRALLIAIVPVASVAGFLSLPLLYAVAFASGSLGVLFYVAYNSLFVSLVPREQFVEAGSLLNGSRAFSFVVGPSLAGGLVQAISAPVTLAIDAVSYLASAFSLSRIAPTEPPLEEERGSVGAGLRYVFASPIMRASLLATATINLFNFVFWALFILYVTRALDVQAGLLGVVLGAGAVGGVLGSLVAGRITRRIGVGPTYVLGCVLFPAPLLLVPLAAGPRPIVLGALFLAEFGSGFGVMLLDIAAGAISSSLVPDRLRSRVSGAYMVVNNGVRPLGSLAGGWLGAAIGLRPTLWIATGGALLGFLFLLPSPIPGLRTLPESAEEA